MNEKVFQMEHEIQSLKSTMQELVEVAKRTGTCSCQGNFNLLRFFYVLTSGVNMLKATNRNYVVPMGAIVIRTRFDEGTESAEVATSGPKTMYN
jgi:hypothetical protein